MLLPIARWFDGQARLVDGGPRLLDDVFPPMSGVPEMLGHRSPPQSDDGWRVRPFQVRRRVSTVLARQGLDATRGALLAELAVLAERPWCDCMLRHLLESALYVCELGRGAAVTVVKPLDPSRERLLRRLLALHLYGLGRAAGLDRRALPLQLAGVPVLCRDLPSHDARGGGVRFPANAPSPSGRH